MINIFLIVAWSKFGLILTNDCIVNCYLVYFLPDIDLECWILSFFSVVSVKWQKELFKDVEIDTSQPPYVFKGQLFDLTGVPPERQKIMVKGGLLKVST